MIIATRPRNPGTCKNCAGVIDRGELCLAHEAPSTKRRNLYHIHCVLEETQLGFSRIGLDFSYIVEDPRARNSLTA